MRGRAQHPGVLAPPALAAVHHQFALRQCDAGKPTWQNPDVFAVVDSEGSKIDMARLQAVLDQSWHRGELNDRLCDPAARVLTYPAPQLVQFSLGGTRADHNALASGAIHRLDDQFLETVQDFLARLIIF